MIHDDSWQVMMIHDDSWRLMMSHDDSSWFIMIYRHRTGRLFLASVWIPAWYDLLFPLLYFPSETSNNYCRSKFTHLFQKTHTNFVRKFHFFHAFVEFSFCGIFIVDIQLPNNRTHKYGRRLQKLGEFRCPEVCERSGDRVEMGGSSIHSFDLYCRASI